MYKNTFSRDPDLNGCWDVHIDQVTSYPGATGTEHNTIGIEQAPNDNRFSGFVSNSPLTEDRGNVLGIVVKKDVYITHWERKSSAELTRHSVIHPTETQKPPSQQHLLQLLLDFSANAHFPLQFNVGLI